MRWLLPFVVFTWMLDAGLAQEPAREGAMDQIRSLINRINVARRDSAGEAFSRLFTNDGEFRVGRDIIAVGQAAIVAALEKPRAWSEVTPPVIRDERIRFVSADVALVDAEQVQYGSVILKQSTPVTLLLRHEGRRWRIVSLRLDPPFGFIFPATATR